MFKNRGMRGTDVKSRMNIVQLGGISCILSGLLFLAQQLFVLPIPRVPSADEALLLWLAEWKFRLSMADEVLFFATLLLIPSIAGLYRVLAKTDQIKALLGCGLLAVNIPVYLFLVIILGRFVYPVYDLELSSESYKLVLSLYYGGMHMAALVLGIAIIILCFAIRKSVIGKSAAYVGFLAGVLAFVGSYPWLLGNAAVFVTQLAFSAWLVLLGVRMLGKSHNMV